jgi:hypothetical protein
MARPEEEKPMISEWIRTMALGAAAIAPVRLDDRHERRHRGRR